MDYLCLSMSISLIVFVVLYLHKTIQLRGIRDMASLMERHGESAIEENYILRERVKSLCEQLAEECGIRSKTELRTKSKLDDKRINSLQKKVKNLEKQRGELEEMIEMEVTLDVLVKEMNKRGYFVEISRGADFNELGQ
jgi:predicted nuclease with TOPRIM domain